MDVNGFLGATDPNGSLPRHSKLCFYYLESDSSHPDLGSVIEGLLFRSDQKSRWQTSDRILANRSWCVGGDHWSHLAFLFSSFLRTFGITWCNRLAIVARWSREECFDEQRVGDIQPTVRG